MTEISPSATLQNHEGAIINLFRDHGIRLVTSSSDGKVSVWNMQDETKPKVMHDFRGDCKKVFLVDFLLYCSSFGNFGSAQGQVQVYDLNRKCWIAIFKGHTMYISECVFHANDLLTASADGSLRLWNTGEMNVTGPKPSTPEERQATRVLKAHKDGVSALVALGGTRVASGGSDNAVRVWDYSKQPDTAACLGTLQGHTGPVRCLLYRTVSSELFSGSQDESVRVWSMQDGQCKFIVRLKSPLVSMFLAPEPKPNQSNFVPLFCQTLESTLQVWNIAKNTAKKKGDLPMPPTLQYTLEGHKGRITAVSVSLRQIFTGGADGVIRRWSIPTGKCLNIMKGHTDIVHSILYWGDRLYTGSADTRTLVWDLKRLEQTEAEWEEELDHWSRTSGQGPRVKQPVSGLDWMQMLSGPPAAATAGTASPGRPGTPVGKGSPAAAAALDRSGSQPGLERSGSQPGLLGWLLGGGDGAAGAAAGPPPQVVGAGSGRNASPAPGSGSNSPVVPRAGMGPRSASAGTVSPPGGGASPPASPGGSLALRSSGSSSSSMGSPKTRTAGTPTSALATAPPISAVQQSTAVSGGTRPVRTPVAAVLGESAGNSTAYSSDSSDRQKSGARGGGGGGGGGGDSSSDRSASPVQGSPLRTAVVPGTPPAGVPPLEFPDDESSGGGKRSANAPLSPQTVTRASPSVDNWHDLFVHVGLKDVVGELEQMFAENMLEWDQRNDLTLEALRAMGLKIGPAMRILKGLGLTKEK